MAERKVMKDIGLNELISVEAPAYIWIALVAAYNTCDWTDGNCSEILRRAQIQLMDPVFLKEQEAAAHEAAENTHSALRNILTGRMPEPEERPGDEQ